MNEPFNNESSDDMPGGLLDRAIESIQAQAIPAGPPPKLVADTLSALDELKQFSPAVLPFFTRSRMMRFTTTAAALVFTASLATLLILAAKSPSAAFGQAIKQVRDARSMTYTQRMVVEGKDKPIVTKSFIAEDGRKRTEQPGAGPITTIFDTNGFTRLVLIEPTKTALVSPARDQRAINAGQMFLEWLEALRKLGDSPDKELGQKDLDGRRVAGFVATKGSFEFTIWVDSATGELVSIEHDSLVNGKEAHITMTDFRFNERLDESLFSFEAPAGYKVRQPSEKSTVRDVPTPGETNVVEALRGYTERDGGKFPASLTDWGSWAVLFSKAARGPEVDPETKRVMEHLGAVLPFLVSLPKDDYAYLGSGKTVEDKDAIVFWYKNPEGTYRAIYGDLSVQDIAEEKLPKK